MRFPETEQGIKAAIMVAGPDGDWSAYINWWGDDAPSEKRHNEAIRAAQAAGADIARSAVHLEVVIVNTPDISGLEPDAGQSAAMDYAQMRRDLPA